MLISVQAGNSDNKLTQQDWAAFVRSLDRILVAYERDRHFFGGPPTHAPWQNVCWVCDIDELRLVGLLRDLKFCREQHQQDSVCVLAGAPVFV